MRCGDCGSEVQWGSAFCSVCGAPVAYFCPRCNAPLPNAAAPCPRCAESRPDELVAGPDGKRVFKFSCPLCRQRIGVPPDWCGLEAFCPSCGEKIAIPFPPAASGSSSPEEAVEPPVPVAGEGEDGGSPEPASSGEVRLKIVPLAAPSERRRGPVEPAVPPLVVVSDPGSEPEADRKWPSAGEAPSPEGIRRIRLASAVLAGIVVIAVAVWLALPSPGGDSAALREAAEQLRVLGGALQHYAVDSGSRLPPGEGCIGLRKLFEANAAGAKILLAGRGDAVPAADGRIGEENTNFAYLGGGLALPPGDAGPIAAELPLVVEKPWMCDGGRIAVLCWDMKVRMVDLPSAARRSCGDLVRFLRDRSAVASDTNWSVVAGNAAGVDFACGR